MSVFSKLRRSKKAAEEHKANQAEKAKESEVKVPYKHVPTHAAFDALSGAPSSWKEADRPKIQEHHKRRSQMVISRTASTLSTVSNMNDRAISIAGSSNSANPGLPRNASYNTFHTTWDNKETMDVRPKPPRAYSYHSQISSYKGTSYGRTYQRGHSYHDSGIGPSPLSSAVHSEGKFYPT